MGWLVASVPGGTTSATGAKSRFTPAVSSSRPQRRASAVRVAGDSPPCTSAEGIVEKPGPRSAWISPPSWFAATKKRTPAVDLELACAWTASAMARTLATPIEVVAVNQTWPTGWSRIALSSAGPSRSLARPSRNSWPIRWARLIPVMTRRTQDAWAVGLGEGVEAGGAAVEVGLGVKPAVGSGVETVVGKGADVVVVIGGPAQPTMTS